MADQSKNVGQWNNARTAMETWWSMLRALRGGTDAMRKAATTLLPQDWAERQKPERYAERLNRSFLFNAYDAAIARIAGAPFAKTVKVTPENLPEPLDKIESDADRCGTSLTSFAQQLLDDMADRGFAMFLVDHVPAPERQKPEDGSEPAPLTLADEEAFGLRPYFVRIIPDNLVGWRAVMENGIERITELRIRELTTKPQDDFSEWEVERISVWNETTVQVWERVVGTNSTDPQERIRFAEMAKSGFVLKDTKPHLFPGNRIPLVVAYASKYSTLFARPPLLDLAWLNVNHWQSSSQQNHILHYARAPILRGKGMTKDEVDKGIQLGAGATALSSNEGFDLAYVEPGGASIEAGKQDLDSIEQRMRMMSDEPLLETQGPTATGEIRADSKKQSKAQRWVETVEWALLQGYQLAAQWRNVELPEDFKAAIWRGFQMTEKSQTDMTTLEAARGRKDLSRETYLKEIQRRDVIDRDLDIDEELERIDEEGAGLANMLPPMPPPGQNGEGEPPTGQPPQPPDNNSRQKPPPAKERAA